MLNVLNLCSPKILVHCSMLTVSQLVLPDSVLLLSLDSGIEPAFPGSLLLSLDPGKVLLCECRYLLSTNANLPLPNLWWGCGHYSSSIMANPSLEFMGTHRNLRHPKSQ